MMSVHKSTCQQTQHQMKDEPEEKVKTEDVMVSIEKTIDDAFKQFGGRFEKLLEEKINEFEEKVAQVAQVGKAENRIATREEYDLEISNGQFASQFPQKFEAKKSC